MNPEDQKVIDDVAKYRWHVVKVMEDSQGPAFAYSVGLYQTFKHPEIIVVGLPPDWMHQIANNAGFAIRGGARFEDGVRSGEILEKSEVTFREVLRAHYHDYLGIALWFYKKHHFPTLQCLWPDRDGRFPWDEGYSDSLKGLQTLLYAARVN